MSITVLTILLFLALILGLMSGHPIAFVLGGIGILFSVVIWGPNSLFMTVTAAYGSMSSFILIAVPLFIFLANILEKSGVVDDLYDSMFLWMGRLNGGLAIGTIVICTILAAMVGTIGAGIVTAALIGYPEMKRRNYDKHLAYGSIMAGGCLGTLIPPSIHFMLYAAITQQSPGRLFMGGFFPGLLLSGLYMGYVAIRTALNPSMGAALPPEARVGWRQKFSSLKSILLPLILIIAVLGSIFRGVATPTEASAVGCVGAIVCAAVHRRLTRKVLMESALDTAKLFGMMLWLLIGASCFQRVYMGMGASRLIEGVAFGSGNVWATLLFMQGVIFFMGCIMDDLPIIMICAPVFNSIVINLGLSPLWFGVVFVVNLQMAMLTPPYGFANFYMKATVPEEEMSTFYRSTFPFLGMQAIGLVITMIFPELALWLPKMMMGD